MNRRRFIKSAARGGLFVPAAYAAAQEVFIDWVSAPAPSGTEWVTSVTGGTTRNNFSGDVGAEIDVGGANVTVTHLGRWVVSGNSGSHDVTIWANPYTSPTAVATVTVNTSGQPAGQFAYVALGSSVTLTASGVYVISSVEVSGGDFWYDNDTTITTTSVITLGMNAYRTGSTGTFNTFGSAGKMYVPLSLKYS